MVTDFHDQAPGDLGLPPFVREGCDVRDPHALADGWMMARMSTVAPLSWVSVKSRSRGSPFARQGRNSAQIGPTCSTRKKARAVYNDVLRRTIASTSAETNPSEGTQSDTNDSATFGFTMGGNLLRVRSFHKTEHRPSNNQKLWMHRGSCSPPWLHCIGSSVRMIRCRVHRQRLLAWIRDSDR
jgi:hypothetical protein